MSGRAHLFVTLVTFAVLVFIVQLLRRRQLHAKYSLLWLSVGMALFLMAAFPRLLDRVSKLLGISYPPTTLFVIAITLLLLIVAHFSWELSRVFAEELALLRADQTESSRHRPLHSSAAQNQLHPDQSDSQAKRP